MTKYFHGLSQYISLKQMRNASFPWPSLLELLIGIVVESWPILRSLSVFIKKIWEHPIAWKNYNGYEKICQMKLINNQKREINCERQNWNKLVSAPNVQEGKAWQLFALKLMMLRFISFLLVCEDQLPLFNLVVVLVVLWSVKSWERGTG